MNKDRFKKPEPKITKKKPTNLGLTNTKSEDCLAVGSPKLVNPSRRASTPTHELPQEPPQNSSPDVSCISEAVASTSTGLKKKKEEHVEPPPKKVVPQFTAEQYQDMLDVKYTKYLQSVFRKKIRESKAAENMNDLRQVRERIIKKQELLKKSTEMLQNIKFNKEIDNLHALHYSQHAGILDTLEKTNCEEYLSTLNKKVSSHRNQLKVKNVELPAGGTEGLVTLITESLEDFGKIKLVQDLETPKVLAEIKRLNQITANEISRGIENLTQVENKLMERAALEICSEHSNPTDV